MIEESENDDLKGPGIGQSKFNWNGPYATGIILILVAVVFFFISLSFDDIFYFPIFIAIAGIVILIQGIVKDGKNKNQAIGKSDILDDGNEIIWSIYH